jgi:hypothetical protein
MIGIFQRVAAILVAQGQQECFLTEDRLGFPRDRRRIDSHRIKHRCPDHFLEVDRGIEDLKAEKDPDGADHQGQRPDIVDGEHHDSDRVHIHNADEEALVVAAAGRDGEGAVRHHDAGHQHDQRQALDKGAAGLSPDQIGAAMQRRNQCAADHGGEQQEVGSEKITDRHEGHADQRDPDHPCARDLASLRPVLLAIGADHLGRKPDVAGTLRQQLLRLGFERGRNDHVRPVAERRRVQAAAGTRSQGLSTPVVSACPARSKRPKC